MDSLSTTLEHRLLSLKLCTAGDLRRCRSYIRRFARDLPTFDSVWLDGLVRQGTLTPYQARLLESSNPDAIALGPSLIVDRIGGGPSGETYRVRVPGSGRLGVVKLLRTDVVTGMVCERLDALVARTGTNRHPSLVVPDGWHRVGDRVAVVSRHISGFHLGELLVRRGRFPPEIVWEIGRQLVTALSLAESQALAHGDIRAANVRLQGDGTIVLVDTGIRAAVAPSWSVHSGLVPDRYDGIAPELIGADRAPDSTSDRYALGCLLWQLLAGRPPFPGGDPLVKLAAHQTRHVPDIRNWAPETPRALAEGIRRLTARDPRERPASFREVAANWGLPGGAGRRKLVLFRRWFDQPTALHASQNGGTKSRSVVSAGLLLALLLPAAWGLANQGARNVLLSWGSRLSGPLLSLAGSTDTKSNKPTSETEDIATENGSLLPKPDARGRLQLESGRSYRAADLSVVGSLVISGPAEGLAQIVIPQAGWRIAAETIRLERVEFVGAGETELPAAGASAALQVQSQVLELEGCRCRWSLRPAERSPTNRKTAEVAPALIAWKPLDHRSARGARGAFANCVFQGPGIPLTMAAGTRQFEFRNCLQVDGRALVQLPQEVSGKSTKLVLQNVTCRGAESIVRWVGGKVAPRGEVELRDSVLDVNPAGGAILELAGFTEEEVQQARIRIAGEGSVVAADVSLARAESSTGHFDPCELPGMVVEGLMTAHYEFSGPTKSGAVGAALRECDAPRRSAAMPGVNTGKLSLAQYEELKLP